jgi:hydroxypyruvate isomerase
MAANLEEPLMDRRQFTQALAASALAVAAPAVPTGARAQSSSPGAGGPFPLSVMLWTVFNDLPFEERLAKVVEAGYTNIELVGEYGKWAPPDFDKADAARKKLGVKFDATAGLKNGVANPEQRDALMEELRQALVPMERLGCPAMIIMSGNVVPGLTREQQHQSCIDSLKKAAAVVEGKQIDGQPVRLLLECIHLEENPHYYLTSASEAIEIVRAVNHPQVQFLYDIYHEQMSFGQLIEKLEKHIDVIGLIHVADVPGRHEPGTGEINYGNVYRKLAELKYKHVVAMEFKPKGDPVVTLQSAKTETIKATTA